jgi:monoamine oxidase
MAQDYDVLVVGAGAAGIAAARKLTQKNKKVKLLEARDRVGGRTQTINFHGTPYDLGAQFPILRASIPWSGSPKDWA